MAITYTLGNMPLWILIGNDGLTAGGGYIRTKSSINKSLDKAVYMDAGGVNPWPNPVVFNANGVQGPFYWKTDSDNPDDLYYLEAYDSDGILLWTVDDYSGDSGSGGGTVTNYINQKNMLVNGLFWRNAGSNAATPTINVSSATNSVIAPSSHAAFVEVTTSTGGATGPDIRFIKDNTSSTDVINFVNFAQGDDPFGADVTPAWSLNFVCSAFGTESYKYIQFPITAKVNSLDNCTVTFVMWGKTASGTANVDVNIRQFYGSSGGGADTKSVNQTCSLTTTWTQFKKTIQIPAASGALGACGNDGTYLRIYMPLSTSDLYIAKPQLYLGSSAPDESFETFDEIDSIVNVQRTADTQTSFRASAPLGWISMNDGSIGSASSGATTRAFQDTFPLFKELYLNVIDAWAPVSGGRTAPGNDITSCITDFVANKTITLPRILGRAMASAGAGAGLTLRALGQYLGEEGHVLTTSEMPSHSHSFPLYVAGDVGPNTRSSSYNDRDPTGNNVTTTSTGGGSAHNIMQPTTFMNVFIKL